jgi:hypothetical protein
MTESPIRESIGTAPLPRPRTALDDSVAAHDTIAVEVAEAAQDTAAPQPEAAHFPWPEPWHFSRGARPRSEFWDVRTASWRSRGPRTTPPAS